MHAGVQLRTIIRTQEQRHPVRQSGVTSSRVWKGKGGNIHVMRISEEQSAYRGLKEIPVETPSLPLTSAAKLVNAWTACNAPPKL